MAIVALSEVLCLLLLSIVNRMFNKSSIALNRQNFPQLSFMIIYRSTWSILMQWIRVILSGDNLKAYCLFVINLITQIKENYRKCRRWKFFGTMHCLLVSYHWRSERGSLGHGVCRSSVTCPRASSAHSGTVSCNT